MQDGEDSELQGDYYSLVILSEIIGYSYVLLWGGSFVQQMVLNCELKNVEGINLDFVLYNITGFACYAGYTAAGYFYPRQSGIISDSNDVVFGCVTFLFTIFIGYQCFCQYERYKNRVSLLCKLVNFAYWAFIIIHYYCYDVFEVYEIKSVYWNVWYCMSYIKLIITVTKYIPQAYWNYLRKSTKGWSHKAVIMDWLGSVLSSLQILVQYINGNNNAFGGNGHSGMNIAKFGLSWISFLFDTFFLIQHYILYNPNTKQALIKKGTMEEIDPIEKQNIDKKLQDSQSTQSTKCSNSQKMITASQNSKHDIISNSSKNDVEQQQQQQELQELQVEQKIPNSKQSKNKQMQLELLQQLEQLEQLSDQDSQDEQNNANNVFQ